MLASTLIAATVVLVLGAPDRLYRAACEGDLAQVKRLLATPAGKAQRDLVVSEDFSSYDMNPLACAVRERHIEIVEALLAAGARPDVEGCEPPLRLAMQPENDEISEALVQMLVAAGAKADLDWGTGTGVDSPLALAAGTGTPELLGLLLEAGARPAGPRGDCSPAVAALQGHNAKALRFLLEHGGSCPDSTFLVEIACHHGDERALRLLLDHGAKLSARDGSGRTSLLACLAWGDPSKSRRAVELLLARGADLKAQDSEGCGALCATAGNSDGGETFAWLLGKGLDPRRECGPILENLRGPTAVKVADLTIGAGCSLEPHSGRLLRRAAAQGELALVRWLLGHGVAADDVDDHGRTALLLAVEKHQEVVVKELLGAGADPQRKDAGGRAAVDIGRETSLEIQKVLGLDEVSRLRREPIAAIILGGSGRTPEDAQAARERFEGAATGLAEVAGLAQGYPLVRRSEELEGLRPGYHIVVLGFCPADQVDDVVNVLKPFFPDVYARPVRARLEAPACPTTSAKVQGQRTVRGPGASRLTVSVLMADPADSFSVSNQTRVLLHATLLSKDGVAMDAKDVLVQPGVSSAACSLSLDPGKESIAAVLRCSSVFDENCELPGFERRWRFLPAGAMLGVQERTSRDKGEAVCGE